MGEEKTRQGRYMKPVRTDFIREMRLSSEIGVNEFHLIVFIHGHGNILLGVYKTTIVLDDERRLHLP
jgi:hypothetical protein